MKHFLTLVVCLFISSTNLYSQSSNNQSLLKTPRVIILATGGTIAGSGESATKAAYTAGQIPIDGLLNAVPEIHDIAEVKGEQVAQIGSQDMDVQTWLKLSKRINEIFDLDLADGVVVTHGTDTQEETAYFLSLTIKSKKPVVVVGAMRPATAMSQDGNRNLLDAVVVASSKDSQDVGVVLAMNEAIFAARDVTKTSTTNMATFASTNFGPIGIVFDGKVSYYYKSIRQTGEYFDVRNRTSLAEVDIYYGYAGASARGIEAAIKDNVQGIVFAGVGNGNFNREIGAALELASNKGIIVCRSARAGSGRVTLDNEVDDQKLGFVVADDLSPQKARILMMLALTKTKDVKQIQKIFFTY